MMKKWLTPIMLAGVIATGFTPLAGAAEAAKDDYMPSLITQTPLEGRMLAIKIVRKTIGTVQRDPAIKMAVRQEYQDDPVMLMKAAELVAIEFKTIAIANNYWR